ncbi:MAG TPA: phosphodiester glycosidase family protein [Myxococcaceae bacterium]|jgi:hypothetical protein
MSPLLGLPLLALSCALLALGVRVLRRWKVRRWLRRAAGIVLIGPSALGLVVSGFVSWALYRGQPEEVSEEWFTGVRYQGLVRQQPRPFVAHLVRVDLREPGIDFLVSPHQPSASGDVLADRTSGFAVRHGVQVAINANYFYPFENNHPLDYTPHVGDPVQIVGLAASRGQGYGGEDGETEGMITLYLSRDRRIGFEQPVGEVWQAISGLGYVLKGGAAMAFEDKENNRKPYPRSIAAVDATGRYLLLLVVDGKQPNYSEGLTLEETAELLLRHGAHTAIQLDGGGSATLVREDGPGDVSQVNTPINFRIPGWERPVGNHLGIYARPLAR